MSGVLVTYVSQFKLGSPTRKSVMVALAETANEDGCAIWKSHRSLALQVEVSEKTISRTMKAFEEEGLVEHVGYRRTGETRTKEYAICLPAIGELDLIKPPDGFEPIKRSANAQISVSESQSEPDRLSSSSGTNTPPNRPDKLSGSESEPDIEGDPTGLSRHKSGRQCPTTRPDPSSTRPLSDGETNCEVEFEEFWEAYPSTGGGSRDAALSAWRKLSPADRRAAVKAAKALREPQTLYPALFLSERRWTPVVAPMAPSQPERPDDPDHGRVWDRFEAAGRLSFWAKALSPDHIQIEGKEIIPIARTVRHHLAHDPEARRLLSGLGLTVRPKQFRPARKAAS